RADRLNSTSELTQVLLDFGQELEQRPIHPEDVSAASEPEYELRRVKRRKGRRSLANFENLPVTTQVYELSAEERTCPGCGVERQESGDRKSTRLNSSHQIISYAVFCLKKKKIEKADMSD